MDIQEIKDRVGQSAERIIASGLGLVKKNKNYKCPNAVAHKNNDKNPSMSWDPKALHFYCFTCGIRIDIYSYYREHLRRGHAEIIKEFEDPQPLFKPKFQLEEITKACLDYLEKRGVKPDTIKHFGLKSYQGSIAFVYYSNGITGVKYRKPIANPPKPKYLSITGSDFGFYNKRNVGNGEELIICEGEIDCMIIYQCGFTNVVSVPTGANAMDKLLKKEKEFLASYKALIIASDNDEAGKKMDTEFIQRFGVKAKLVDKSLFTKKDINEEYCCSGQEQVKKIIESARVKIEGLRDLDKQPYKGLKTIKGNFISTGLKTIDYALNDLAPQCVTLVTGRANDGKSTFVNQVIANAVDEGNKVFLVSGEGVQEVLINNFYKAVIGRDEKCYDLIKVNKRYSKEPKPEILKALQYWHNGKLKLFCKGDSELKTTEQLFQLLSIEVKINSYNLLVIDNLMSILSVEKASEKLEAQADFMQKCCDLAKSENTHIILVLHPNKTVAKGQLMEFEQISGTLDLPNKADNIILVKRERDQEKLKQGINGEIIILKNRYFPDLNKIQVHFEQETGLLLEIDELTNNYIAYNFKWRQFLNARPHQLGMEVDIPCP